MSHELTTLYDRRFRLADFPGKIVIINVFGTWCGPCRTNLSDLIKIKQEYAGGVEVIGLVPREGDGNIAVVRRFVRMQSINFPVVWGDDDFIDALNRQESAPKVLPQSFIIDSHGHVLKHFTGYNVYKTPELTRKVLNESDAKRR